MQPALSPAAQHLSEARAAAAYAAAAAAAVLDENATVVVRAARQGAAPTYTVTVAQWQWDLFVNLVAEYRAVNTALDAAHRLAHWRAQQSTDSQP